MAEVPAQICEGMPQLQSNPGAGESSKGYRSSTLTGAVMGGWQICLVRHRLLRGQAWQEFESGSHDGLKPCVVT